jgi:DNA-binding response OmpR family regulator
LAQRGSHMKVGDKTARLLVVDDEPRLRQSLAELMQLQGHAVDLADNGRSATQLLDQGDYDLVLLDLFMPDMDGYAVMQYMLRRHPKVAVIARSLLQR